MADLRIQSVPNNINSWGEAAKYLQEKKCQLAADLTAYQEELKGANPGRETPKSADVRWFPVLHHDPFPLWLPIDHNPNNWPIVFIGPDPECLVKEEAKDLVVVEPQINGDHDAGAKPDAVTVEPPRVERPTAKKEKIPVSARTKEDISSAVKTALGLIDDANSANKKIIAGKLNKVIKKAREAVRSGSEEVAIKALTELKEVNAWANVEIWK